MEFDVNKRFLDFIKTRNYLESDIYKTIGAKQQQVNNWIRFREQIPNSRIIDIIKKYPEINANWLIRGVGEMITEILPSSLKSNALWLPPVSINDNNHFVKTYSCPDCIWRDKLLIEKEKTILALEQLVNEIKKHKTVLPESESEIIEGYLGPKEKAG